MAGFLYEGREPIYTPPEREEDITLGSDEEMSEQEKAALKYLLAKYARTKGGFLHAGRKPIVPCSNPNHIESSDDVINFDDSNDGTISTIADAIQRRF